VTAVGIYQEAGELQRDVLEFDRGSYAAALSRLPIVRRRSPSANARFEAARQAQFGADVDHRFGKPAIGTSNIPMTRK
jgi:hypothetical protein